MKNKWKSMRQNYAKIRGRVQMSGASHPEVDWPYYDDMGQICKDDPSMHMPVIYQTMNVGATGAALITYDSSFANEFDDDEEPVANEELVHQETNTPLLSSSAPPPPPSLSSQVSAPPATSSSPPSSSSAPPTTSSSVPSPSPSSVPANPSSTTASSSSSSSQAHTRGQTSGPGIGRGHRTVLDVDQVGQVMANLNEQHTTSSTRIVDNFFTQLVNESDKRRAEHDLAEARSMRRMMSYHAEMREMHDDFMYAFDRLYESNREILGYARIAYNGNGPVPLPANITPTTTEDENDEN
ncbi:hypothetical protein INT45_007037 [Circinella minor]|uniref:MADF domain-containing protein n=1 Tax=Circinella minor TaxID=1195481 RepID=A0A8H7VCG7_9FUNG|nr:hypothetical protein INT45_007037 [Circinella minor]